jgi:hypothetical protein
MKKIFVRGLLWLLGIIVLIIVAAYIYLRFMLPDVGKAPEVKVQITPARLERGKYLANHVALCMDCHSVRDWGLFAGPPTPGTLGAGGERFGPEEGLPGVFYSRNITPYGIGSWTDGQLYRAITEGVDKNGRALFPIMPYLIYGQLDTEDIYSIMAYVRTLAPIKNEIPPSHADFPMNLIMNTIPKKANPQKAPDTSNQVAYGKYLAIGCIECHTVVDKGRIIPEKAFQGGREFILPAGTIRSANLTPDKETGLGNWSEDVFVKRFKVYADSSYIPQKVGPKDFNTIMPWVMYSGMKDSDIKAIYAFLRTLKPVHNEVQKFTPKP